MNPLRCCIRLLMLSGACAMFAAASLSAAGHKLVLVAGKPSHGPGAHEFNAGVQLLAKCLAQGAPQLKVEVVLNGWPTDESVFNNADAVVFYMDGGAKHELVLDGGARLKKVDEWTKRGVSVGVMHYGTEVVAAQAGAEFQKWVGGYYEDHYSCNPMWAPEYAHFVTHPVTRGVQPFHITDEWYFNIRFAEGFSADKPTTVHGTTFTPILVATPSDAVRD